MSDDFNNLPTLSNLSGPGAPAAGGKLPPQGPGTPPSYGGRQFNQPPEPEQRGKSRIVIFISAALALLILTLLLYGTVGLGWFNQNSPARAAQQAVATSTVVTASQPTATDAPSATATTAPTNTPTPKPTNTPKPKPTNTPAPKPTNTPTPAILSSGTITIPSSGVFDLDAGVLTSSAARDIWWKVDSATPLIVGELCYQYSAQIVLLPLWGTADFNAVTAAQLHNYSYAATCIAGDQSKINNLIPGNIFAVRTGQGHYAKAIVLAFGANLQIQWVTYP